MEDQGAYFQTNPFWSRMTKKQIQYVVFKGNIPELVGVVSSLFVQHHETSTCHEYIDPYE